MAIPTTTKVMETKTYPENLNVRLDSIQRNNTNPKRHNNVRAGGGTRKVDPFILDVSQSRLSVISQRNVPLRALASLFVLLYFQVFQ